MSQNKVSSLAKRRGVVEKVDEIKINLGSNVDDAR